VRARLTGAVAVALLGHVVDIRQGIDLQFGRRDELPGRWFQAYVDAAPGQR